MNKDIKNILLSGVLGILGIIIILLTIYIIVDVKTQGVVASMYQLEYDKVGGKENYDKINKITLQQIQSGLDNYDNGQAGAAPQAQAAAKAPTGATLDLEKVQTIITEGAYILGNPDAEITWIEYSDLECPFCKKLHDSGVIGQVLENYDGKVNFIFKHFPLNFHANAQKEAEAAECAGELAGSEVYYTYINTIFERTRGNGTGFALTDLGPLAAELGVNEGSFQTCLDSGKYADKVIAQMDEGKEFGISGTPGNVLINTKTGKWDKLPGAYPYESFKSLIDSLLQ